MYIYMIWAANSLLDRFLKTCHKVPHNDFELSKLILSYLCQ